MDPNETLRKIRELATDIERGKDEFEIAETAQEFRQWFEALDEYLKQGGFLPKDWRRKPWDKDQED